MRTRITVRRLMAAVLVVALILGLGSWYRRRTDRFRELGSKYARIAATSRMQALAFEDPAAPGKSAEAAKLCRVSEYHRALSDKYRRAADRPWLPVAPDPPQPE